MYVHFRSVLISQCRPYIIHVIIEHKISTQTSHNCPTLRLASLVYLTLGPIWCEHDRVLPNQISKNHISWSGPLIDLVTTKMQDTIIKIAWLQFMGRHVWPKGLHVCIACIGRLIHTEAYMQDNGITYLPTNNTHAYPCCYSQQQLLAEAYDDSTGSSECRLVDCDWLSLCIVCNDLNWKLWN